MSWQHLRHESGCRIGKSSRVNTIIAPSCRTTSAPGAMTHEGPQGPFVAGGELEPTELPSMGHWFRLYRLQGLHGVAGVCNRRCNPRPGRRGRSVISRYTCSLVGR